MNAIRTLVLASFMAVGATTLVAAPVVAYAGDKKEEKKCDKDGKPCKDGDNCKAENCKKAK